MNRATFARASVRAVVCSGVVAFLIAVTMTWLDWRRNPGGIFRDQDFTNWSIVLETAISWFVPTLPVASFFALPAVWWLSRRD